jgi:Protein of unknown function (DUF3313)
MPVTALSPVIGYENAAHIAEKVTGDASTFIGIAAKDIARSLVSQEGNFGRCSGTRDVHSRRGGNSMFGGRLNSLWSLVGLLLTGGCATVPFEQSGSLSSYRSLAQSDGILTRARVSANKDQLLAAKTIRLAPTSFAESAVSAGLSEVQRNMVANAIDRSICIGLADRFHIAAAGEPADLSVRAVITYVGLTDETVAGVSRAASVGVSIVEKVFVPVPVPIPTPRIPIGLGGLAVEAEALDQTRRQQAAMVWARGADAFLSKPKVSTAGDAYDLASSFASDFSKLLVTGSSPFQTLPSLPSVHGISAMFGGPPKEPACEVFGRGPGVAGLFAGFVGLPPEWTDKGAPERPPASEIPAPR